MYHIGGTPFPIWNRSCSMSNRFLKRQVRWSGIPISFRIFQFIVIHTVKGFGIVNKAEIDVFLELSCFFDDPADVGNLISGSFAISKTSLNIWKFTVHMFLKPQLKSFVASSIDLCGNLKEWMSRLLFPYILAYKYSTIL